MNVGPGLILGELARREATHRDELGVVCAHGQLERVCEVCELTAERDARADYEARLLARIAALDLEVSALTGLLREVLNDGQVGIRSESWYERARAAMGEKS